MRYPILFSHIIIGIFSLLGLCSCTKDDIFLYLHAEEIKNTLYSIQETGSSIIIVQQKKDVTSIILSNGTRYSFKNPTLGTIGLDGYWYINGIKTPYLWDNSEESINLILRNINKPKNETNGLLGIIEGYEAWTFCFDDWSRITIVKELFSYDPDLILRGIGHRGYSKEAPENTLPAFRLAKLNGFQYVETDVRLTSDGIPVLLHDASIDRTSNGLGKVKDLSLSQLKQYDFGLWKDDSFAGTTIPTLDEFLNLCCDIGLSPYIELKEGKKAQIEAIVDLIALYGLSKQTTIVSFDIKLLSYVHEYDPYMRLGLTTYSVSEATVTNAISIMDKNDVYIGSKDWSSDAIEICKRANIPVEVWLINDVKTISSLPPYVSGVVSNYLHAGRIIHNSLN